MSNLKAKNPWLIRNLLYVIAIMLSTLVVGSVALKAMGLLQGLATDTPPLSTLLTAIGLQWGAFMLSIYIVFIRRGENPWASLGFSKNNNWKSLIAKAFLAYIIYLVLNVAIVITLAELGVELNGYQAQDPRLPVFGVTPLGITLAVVVMVILAPIIEEIFFRGYILNLLANRLGNSAGNILTALIFAGIHLEPQSFFGLFLLGLVMNELFLRTKSLYATILFHIINNAFALMAEYYL